MTMRARLAAPVWQVVQEINLFLRGWAGYFRYGNSAYAQLEFGRDIGELGRGVLAGRL